MKGYLIRIWKGDVLVKDLNWETEKNADDFNKEVAESVAKGIRVTIEEKDDKRANEKTR